MSRRTVRLLTVALSVSALLATGIASPAAAGKASFPDRIELPDGFQPEGIAIRHTTAYLGSLADGDIYGADLRTGRGRVVSQGPGTPSVGLKIDRHGRLFVAGGPSGSGRVVDTSSGRILASYPFTTDPATFVNDVVLTHKAAWFTDSQQPQVYAVPLGRNGRPAGPGAVRTLRLTGDYVHVPGDFNANGIAETPDGRGLVIVQSSTGLLFRVDPRTGATRRIDLGGALMTNGDGLLLDGTTLYVVQNQLNRIAVIELDRAGTTGHVVRHLTSTDFDVPTTAAAFGHRLYLPNARFTTPPTPQTPYWVTAVRR